MIVPINESRPATTTGERLVRWTQTAVSSESTYRIVAPIDDVNGILAINSSPSEAEIFVDGVGGNRTNATLSIPPGRHRIELELDGYGPVSDQVTVEQGIRSALMYVLTPVTTAATPTTETPTRTKTQTATPTEARTPTITATTVATTPPSHSPTPTRTPTPTTVPITTTAATTAAVRVVATAVPTVVTVPATPVMIPSPTATPVTKTGDPLTEHLLRPVTITVKGYNFTPTIRLSSPYYQWRLAAPTPGEIPKSVLESSGDRRPHFSGEFDLPHQMKWSDLVRVNVEKDAPTANIYLRWATEEQEVRTGMYQISRFPFPSDPEKWRNKDVPGLVESGPITTVMVDYKDFQYFSLDLLPAINHDPSLPPLYTGPVTRDHESAVRGVTLRTLDLGITGIRIGTKNTRLGPVTVPLPVNLGLVNVSGYSEKELAEPNADGMDICTDCQVARQATSPLSELYVLKPGTYYIRVVPVKADQMVGVPSLPVEVHVNRTQPCSANPTPGTVSLDLRPPSSYIVSYISPRLTDYRPFDPWHPPTGGSAPEIMEFVQDIQAQNGLRFVSTTDIPITNPFSGDVLGTVPAGYHDFRDNPGTWEQITDAFGDFFSFVEDLVDWASGAWQWAKNAVIQIAAKVVLTATFGQYDCSSDQYCTGALNAGLTAVMTMYGVPPSLPTSAELEDIGTDYLIKLAAKEYGVDSYYEALPEEWQDGIREKAQEVAPEIIGAHRSAASGARGGAGPWIPDPIFTMHHPATLNVRVHNPKENGQATTAVFLRVRDSAGLFKPSSQLVPELQPGEGVTVPIVLEENLDNGLTTDQWNVNLKGSPGTTFILDYAAKGYAGTLVEGLDETSNGKDAGFLLQSTAKDGGGSCFGSSAVRVSYPPEWKFSLEHGRSYGPAGFWDPQITDQSGGAGSGYLRKV
jgi:hypothetical protein